MTEKEKTTAATLEDQEWEEPGRTHDHADGSDTEWDPRDPGRTQSHAEGDRDTIEEALRQRGLG
jgi:hypothetical protein